MRNLLKVVIILVMALLVLLVSFAITETYALLARPLLWGGMINISVYILIGLVVYLLVAILMLILFIKFSKKILGI